MPFMSLDELERQYGVAPQQQPQQPPPRRDVAALPGEVQTNNSGTSEFGKGFRAGWQGWKGNYTRNAAMAAELAGNQQASDGLNKAADGAVTAAPRVQSMFDIQSMGDVGDYMAGTAGQAMASIAQMGTMSAIGGLLGAGVAGKGGFRIGSTLGGLGDAILQQAGADLAKQRASEEARKADKWDRARAAYGTSLVQGPLDFITDRMLLGKVFNPVKDAIRGSGFNQAAKYFGGQVAKDMVKEAVPEGAQELLGQAQTKALGDTTPYNWRDVVDNAVAGAVGGGIMGAPGSVRNTLAAKTPDGSMVERVAGKVNEYTDALKQGFTDLGAEAGKAAADPAGAAEAAKQATKDKFTEWADMAQGTAAGKFTKDVLDSFTGAYRKKAEEVAKAAQEQAKANPEQAKSTYQQAADTMRNLWRDSKRTVMDMYDSLRTEKQTGEDGEKHNVYEGTARRTDKPQPQPQQPQQQQQPQQGSGRVFEDELLPTEPTQGEPTRGEPTQGEPTQGEPTRATQSAEVEQEAPSPDAAQGPAAGFSFNEDNDAGLTAFLARPDAMRQSLAEAAQMRLKGTDPRIAQVDTTNRRGQALLQELSRRHKAGEPLDFDSVLQAVDEQVGSKPGEKQYSLLRDSYDNFQFMKNRLQGDAVKQIPAHRLQEVLRGVEDMIRSGKILQSDQSVIRSGKGPLLLEGLFGPNADEVLQYVRRERTDTADNGVAALEDDGVSVAGVEGAADERDDATAFDEDMGGTGDTVRDAFQGFTDYALRQLRQLQEVAPQGVQYRKGTDGLPMRRDSPEFLQHEQDLLNEAGYNPALRTTTVNALQYLREEITPNNRARARAAMLRKLQAQDINRRIDEGMDDGDAYEAVKSEVSRFGEDAYLAKHYMFRTDDRSYEERGLSDKDWAGLRPTGEEEGSPNITVMRDGKPTKVNPLAVSMMGQRALEGQYKGIDNATVARFFAEGMSQLINDPEVNGFSDAKGNAVQFTDKMDIAPNTVVYVRNGKRVTYGDIAPLINKPTPEQAKTNAARDKAKNPPYQRGKYSHLFDNSLLASEQDIEELHKEVQVTLGEKRESALKLSKKVDFVVRAGKRAKRTGRKEERDALAAEYRELKSSYDKLTGFISSLEDRAFELETGDVDMIARSNLEREQGGSVDNDSADGESTRYKRDTASAIVGRETGYKADPGARNADGVGRPLQKQPTKEMLEAQRLDALRRKGPEGARALIDFAWRTLADGDGNRNPDQVMRSVRNTAAKYYSPAAVDRAIEIAEDLPQGLMRAAVQDGLEEARAIWNERSDDLAKQVRDAGRDAARPTEAPYNKRLPPPHTMTVEALYDELKATPSATRRDALLAEAGLREEAARNGGNYEPRPHTPVDKPKRAYRGESPTLGTTPVEQMSDAELRAERSSVDQFLTDSGFAPTGDARYDAAQKKLSARYSEVSRELQQRGRTRSAQAAQEAADARNAPRATEAPYTAEQPVRSMTTEELRTELDWLEEGLADAGEASEVKRVPGLTMAEQARYDDLRSELDAREGARGPWTTITYEAGHTAPYDGDYGAAKPTPKRNAPDYTAARKLTVDLAAALKGDVKPVEFIKGMREGELQQVRDTLQALKPGLRRNAFLNAVNDVLDGPNGDGSGGGKAKAAPSKKTDAGDKQFSKQAPSGQGAREKFVREYLHRVFGDEPKAVFSDTFGFAGSYDRDGDFFEFSLHAPLGTEAHEALHRWFKKLQDSNDPGAQEMIKTIIKASTSEHTMARLRELLKDHPDALKQLSDPEEAAAYAFQFYSYGLLKLESAPAKGFFGKIAAAVKRFLKLASDEQRTQQFFDYFSQGKWAADKRPSVVAQVVRDSYSASSKVRWARQQLAPLGEATSKLFRSAADRLENTEVPALKQLSRLFKAEVGDDGGMGFLQRAVNTRNRWVNTYAKAVKGLSDKQKANVLAFVRGEEVAGGMTAEESAAVKAVRSLFDEVYDHAQKRGVPLKRRANYFPRVWDAEKIRARQDDFVSMLVGKYGFSTDGAHRVRATLQTGANDHVVNESPEDPGYNPFFSAVNERKLPEMDAEDIKPFLETSLDGIMARYLQQASKRIEYEAKFGAKGERIHAMLEKAKRQGASEEDLATAKASVMAMEGTMPVTLSSRWQTFNDVMITYQNVRLLPLSILIQATDALGIAARSGSMNNAWRAFMQGIKDMPKWLKKNPKLNEWDQVTVAMGVLEDTALEDVSQTYFNTQTSGMARTINDAFFKWTLMDGWNKSMRVMATKTATEFIAEHAAGKSEHSARMLKELGLTQAQAKAMLDKDGKLVLDPSNEQQREAIFRFVDQAVIRANPADRTVWGSDPRFAVIQHLKQYVYSFHRNILAHAKHEASEGNWAPVQMLATYVPVMAAGMYVRALAGNGGELPEYMEQWGFWDWVWNAFDRSGIAGLYNYHLGDLPGPTVSQAANAVKASQRGTLGAELAEAVPGHQFASML